MVWHQQPQAHVPPALLMIVPNRLKQAFRHRRYTQLIRPSVLAADRDEVSRIANPRWRGVIQPAPLWGPRLLHGRTRMGVSRFEVHRFRVGALLQSVRSGRLGETSLPPAGTGRLGETPLPFGTGWVEVSGSRGGSAYFAIPAPWAAAAASSSLSISLTGFGLRYFVNRSI